MTIRTNGSISNLAGTGPASLHMQSANKAWCNFNQNTSVGVRNSLNISSFTDNSTGRATFTLTANMDSVDFAAPFGGTTASGSSLNYSNGSYALSASQVYYERENSGGSGHDSDNMGFNVSGDLA